MNPAPYPTFTAIDVPLVPGSEHAHLLDVGGLFHPEITAADAAEQDVLIDMGSCLDPVEPHEVVKAARALRHARSIRVAGNFRSCATTVEPALRAAWAHQASASGGGAA